MTTRRPFGCVTGIALVFALLTVLLIGVAAVATGNGIFAPGPLNGDRGDMLGGVTSHADLGGSCDACHAQAWSPDRMADRCLTHQPNAFSNCRQCHTTVAWKPADFSATHSFPMDHRNAGGVCTRCHVGSWAVYTCSKCHSDAKMNEHHKEVPNYSLTTCAKCHPKGRNDQRSSGVVRLRPVRRDAGGPHSLAGVIIGPDRTRRDRAGVDGRAGLAAAGRGSVEQGGPDRGGGRNEAARGHRPGR